ncbi:hypothetical protein JCM11641_001489 [Rhodosporidiobolus odoratus]
MFRAFLDWLRSLFWSSQLDIACIGLQNAGKTSLVNVLTRNEFSESMIPTVGFNLRKIQKGNVTLKVWDLAGQPRFRSIWERYCVGVSAIVWVLDSADRETFPTARAELASLLQKHELAGIPLLVLANKNDLKEHAKVDEVIKDLDLRGVVNREVSVYSISAKSSHNIDVTLSCQPKATIRIPTFASPPKADAPVPQTREEARQARLKTNGGDGQWQSLNAFAAQSQGTSLAHLLGKKAAGGQPTSSAAAVEKSNEDAGPSVNGARKPRSASQADLLASTAARHRQSSPQDLPNPPKTHSERTKKASRRPSTHAAPTSTSQTQSELHRPPSPAESPKQASPESHLAGRLSSSTSTKGKQANDALRVAEEAQAERIAQARLEKHDGGENKAGRGQVPRAARRSTKQLSQAQPAEASTLVAAATAAPHSPMPDLALSPSSLHPLSSLKPVPSATSTALLESSTKVRAARNRIAATSSPQNGDAEEPEIGTDTIPPSMEDSTRKQTLQGKANKRAAEPDHEEEAAAPPSRKREKREGGRKGAVQRADPAELSHVKRRTLVQAQEEVGEPEQSEEAEKEPQGSKRRSPSTTEAERGKGKEKEKSKVQVNKREVSRQLEQDAERPEHQRKKRPSLAGKDRNSSGSVASAALQPAASPSRTAPQRRPRSPSPPLAVPSVSSSPRLPIPPPLPSSSPDPAVPTARKPKPKQGSAPAEPKKRAPAKKHDREREGEKAERQVRILTERLKGNKGKLNIWDVVGGGSKKLLDRLMEDEAEHKSQKALRAFERKVQRTFLQRSAHLSTLTTLMTRLSSSRRRAKKLRTQLLYVQHERVILSIDAEGRLRDEKRTGKENETISSTHDFLAGLEKAAESWR